MNLLRQLRIFMYVNNAFCYARGCDLENRRGGERRRDKEERGSFCTAGLIWSDAWFIVMS